MIVTDTNNILLHVEYLGCEGFRLWAKDSKQLLRIEEWKPLVFTWHRASAYGTFVQKDKDSEALTLAPWMALDFFASAPEQTFQPLSFSPRLEELREVAVLLQSVLKEGAFWPDSEAWQQGKRAWKTDDAIAMDENSSLFEEWLSLCIDDMIAGCQEVEQAWEGLLERAPMLQSVPNESSVSFTEEQWLERIGWKEDRAPFTTALRLEEPEEDGGLWRLAVLLQDKKSSARQFEWEAEDAAPLPRAWQGYSDKIEQNRKLWLRLAPTLAENGEIKTYLNEEEALTFLTQTSETLSAAGVDIFLPPWWEDIRKMKARLKAKVKSAGSSATSFFGMDTLLQFDWKVATGGLELSEQQFQYLVDQERSLVKIDGRWIRLDRDFIKQIREMKKQYEEQGLTLHDALSQSFSEADDEEEAEDEDVMPNVEIELNRQLKSLTKRLEKAESVPDIDIPNDFHGELRPYQRKGSSWLLFLRKFGLGGCLADDMGLGKTIQTIVYLLRVKKDESTSPATLIVCPTSVLTNWHKELQRFAPSLRCVVYHGPNRPKEDQFVPFAQQADVVLTSYNIAQLNQEELASFTWGAAVLDEAQNIKNSRTKQARAVRRLTAGHKIALTGTPIENHLSELWSIFQFLNPGYLGSRTAFQEHFITPIERHHDNDKMKQIQRLIHPFLLRRTKTQEAVALDLPEKQELKTYCHLTSEQAALYEQLVSDIMSRIETLSGMERRGLIFSMLTRIKQLCDHPGLYLKEEGLSDFENRSEKVQQLVELIEELRENGESCLIFTQYVGMGRKLHAYLKERFGGNVSFLHGGTPQARRAQMIDDFQKNTKGIFILSLKAGGTGVNLTAANHVIHFDRWWNPAVENQATDRAHRIGQDRFVQVHKMITTGTLEEKVDEMIEKKRYLSEQIVGGEQWISELSTSDLRELFTLRTQWMEG